MNKNLLNDGYVVDVPYPTFVHRQAMPVWLTSLVQLKGNHAPDLSQPYRYLELGCAMGIHLHLTAAANPMGHFVGVDFNIQQLMVAKEGLGATQIDNVEFIHASFKALLNQDIEPFDFIVTHGVWSWISAENQQVLLQVISKFLKPGGIVYCGYMSHPGATELCSIQKLMFEMSRNLNGDSATKAIQSLSLARKVGQSEMGLFTQVPSLNQTLKKLAQDKPNYIAHDFLSEHWQPQHSADMIRAFGQHDMAYITGAGIAEHLDAISLKPEIVQIIQSLPLVTLQETVRDIALHSLQRQDIYIKNRKKLNESDQQLVFKTIKFALLPNAPVGQALKNDPKIGRILDILKVSEHILRLLQKQALSIMQLLALLNLNISMYQLKDIILLLVWAGYIHPTQIKHSEKNYRLEMNQWMQQQQLNWRCLQHFGTVTEIES